MSVIESLVPAVEVYSIDEAFADLTGVQGDLERLGRIIRSSVYRNTGIPIGVGIAGTKTVVLDRVSIKRHSLGIFAQRPCSD